MDQMIFHTFVIEVEYVARTADGKEVLKMMLFTSRHPVESNFFKNYLKIRMQNEPDFVELAEEPFKETLVPLKNFCR